MATATETVDKIDVTEEPEIKTFTPKLPRAEDIDIANVAFSYDRESDTLLVHLFGRGRHSVSLGIARDWYIMVDPDTEDLVGFHLQRFLGFAVEERPWLLDILDIAELRGITPVEIHAIRRRVLGPRRRIVAMIRALWPSEPQQKKREAIERFLNLKPPLGEMAGAAI